MYCLVAEHKVSFSFDMLEYLMNLTFLSRETRNQVLKKHLLYRQDSCSGFTG